MSDQAAWACRPADSWRRPTTGRVASWARSGSCGLRRPGPWRRHESTSSRPSSRTFERDGARWTDKATGEKYRVLKSAVLESPDPKRCASTFVVADNLVVFLLREDEKGVVNSIEIGEVGGRLAGAGERMATPGVGGDDPMNEYHRKRLTAIGRRNDRFLLDPSHWDERDWREHRRGERERRDARRRNVQYQPVDPQPIAAVPLPRLASGFTSRGARSDVIDELLAKHLGPRRWWELRADKAAVLAPGSAASTRHTCGNEMPPYTWALVRCAPRTRGGGGVVLPRTPSLPDSMEVRCRLAQPSSHVTRSPPPRRRPNRSR
jgi:hypothetical protein